MTSKYFHHHRHHNLKKRELKIKDSCRYWWCAINSNKLEVIWIINCPTIMREMDSGPKHDCKKNYSLIFSGGCWPTHFLLSLDAEQMSKLLCCLWDCKTFTPLVAQDPKPQSENGRKEWADSWQRQEKQCLWVSKAVRPRTYRVPYYSI